MPKAQSPSTTANARVASLNPAFAQLIDGCASWERINKNPPAGTTLMIPSKEIAESILSEYGSRSMTEMAAACERVGAYILPAYLESTQRWTERSDSLHDMRFPFQKIKVGSAKNESGIPTVRLVTDDGKEHAKLVYDADANITYRRVAIWIIESGDILPHDDARNDVPLRGARRRAPPSEDGAASATGRTRTRASKTGGYVPTRDHLTSLRFGLAVMVEGRFATQCMTMARADTRATRALPPFLTHVMSFAQYMYKTDRALFFDAILPLIRFRTADFYAIFESHREPQPDLDDDGYLIPTAYIESWWNECRAIIDGTANIDIFRKWINERIAELRGESAVPAIFAKSREIIEQVDAMRVAIEPSETAPSSKILETIHKWYATAARTNSIGTGTTIANLYGARLAKHYAQNPLLKLVQDELAFILEPIMDDLATHFDNDRYVHIINLIGTICHTTNFDKIAQLLPLTGTKHFSMINSPVPHLDYIAELRAFINSTMFFWIPLDAETMANYPIESAPERQKEFEQLWNADEELRLKHQRIYSKSLKDMQEIALTILRSIDAKDMTPELEAYLKAQAQQ
jgi:hypothetical protein